jgi:hypothetical protein
MLGKSLCISSDFQIKEYELTELYSIVFLVWNGNANHLQTIPGLWPVLLLRYRYLHSACYPEHLPLQCAEVSHPHHAPNTPFKMRTVVSIIYWVAVTLTTILTALQSTRVKVIEGELFFVAQDWESRKPLPTPWREKDIQKALKANFQDDSKSLFLTGVKRNY